MIAIYGLRDSSQKLSTSYFYVGSAKDSKLRLEQHKKHTIEGATKLYYAKMREIGIDNVVADELDVAFDESERIDVEEFWWNQLKAVGHTILNGSPKRGYAKIYSDGFSPEHCKALGDAQRGKVRPNRRGKPSGMKGKAYPESGKKALSDYYRERRESGNPVRRTDEQRKALSEAKIGKPNLKLKGKPRSEEIKRKVSESHIGINIRANMSEFDINRYNETLRKSTAKYWNEIHSIMNELSIDSKSARKEFRNRRNVGKD